MNFSNWIENKLTITNLLLDPLNPRIPIADENLGQRVLIEDLIHNDKVYELAKNIVERGYYNVESMIGIKGNGRNYYIIEGNRRLAALKLLLNPTTAPEPLIPKFKALKHRPWNTAPAVFRPPI